VDICEKYNCFSSLLLVKLTKSFNFGKTRQSVDWIIEGRCFVIAAPHVAL